MGGMTVESGKRFIFNKMRRFLFRTVYRTFICDKKSLPDNFAP